MNIKSYERSCVIVLEYFQFPAILNAASRSLPLKLIQWPQECEVKEERYKSYDLYLTALDIWATQ